MNIKEIIQSIGEKRRARNELLNQMSDQVRMQKIVEERLKSSNERELEKFQREEREENIKEELDFYRKKRRDDISFNHNPLNTKNITNHTDWEVLKERNLFKGRSNMFNQEATVMRNNNNLLKNNRRLLR